MISGEQIKFKAASDNAYNFILKQIISGNWKPGAIVIETEITESLGISRTPVREAFIRLMTENYLEKLSNNRLCVAKVSLKQLKEIYMVRSFLEEKIIEELIKHLNPKQIEELGQIVDYLEVSVKRGNVMDSLKYIDRFHDYLARVLNNEILLDTLKVINGHIARYRSLLVLVVSESDLAAMRKNHKEIYQVIVNRKIEMAKQMMLDWNRISYRFLEKSLIMHDYVK